MATHHEAFADKAKKEIHAQLTVLLDKVSQKDADGLVECFTENAALIIDGHRTYKTKKGLYVLHFFAQPGDDMGDQSSVGICCIYKKVC